MLDTLALLLKLGGFLTALLLVLLALPQSKLRDFCLPIIAWTFVIGCGAYVASPMDVLPDVIPIVGWVDDLVAAAAGVGAAVAALTYKKS